MNIDVMKGLIELLRHNGDSIDNRISVQKQAYLLQQLGYPRFASPRYTYHHFGPYSRDLSAAVLDGWVREKREEFNDEYVRYSYHLTDQTPAFHAQPMAEPYAHMVERMRAQHWRTLELAATAMYFEHDRRMPADQAFARALELKEACHPYEAAARDLLADLKSAAQAPPTHQAAQAPTSA